MEIIRNIDTDNNSSPLYKVIYKSSLCLIESWATFHLNLLSKPDLIIYLLNKINDDNILMIEKVFCESFHHSKSYKIYDKEEFSYTDFNNFLTKLDIVEMQSLKMIINKLKEISGSILSNQSLLSKHFLILSGIAHIFSDLIENFVFLLFLVSINYSNVYI